MHAQEIRAMGDAEVLENIENLRKEMFNLRFQKATGQLADTSRVRQVRRELARLQTIVREREIWAEIEGQGEV